MHFKIKNTLKSNYNYTSKQNLNILTLFNLHMLIHRLPWNFKFHNLI
jgi:hypothetical protein